MASSSNREDRHGHLDLDHESQTYLALHDAMMNFYFNKDYRKCVELAEKLLTKQALPDLLRARCHMILYLRKKSSVSAEHAEQAVALIEGTRSLGNTEEFPQEQLEEAHRCLQAAKDRK